VNSSSFEQGDIVVANIVYSEQIGVKTRPALVISNTGYNKKSDDLILLKITSAGTKTQYDILLNNKNIEEGELKTESHIMVDNPVTTYKKLIQQKIGKITKQKLLEVKQKTKELYNL
jgi:mRNA interferase MazF